MAGKRRKKVRERDVTGLEYFHKLLPLLERLHGVGCQRDRAGNRGTPLRSVLPAGAAVSL